MMTAIQSSVELVVRHLLDGPIRHALVGLERVDDGGHEFSGEVHVAALLENCGDRPGATEKD